MKKEITFRIFIGFLIAAIGGMFLKLAEFVAGEKFTYRKKDIIEKLNKNTQ